MGTVFRAGVGRRKKGLPGALSLSMICSAFLLLLLLSSDNPVQIRQQVHVLTEVVLCVRDSGVCGGGVVPALHPSSQPDQPGGDQRQAGVREDGGAGAQGQGWS